MVKATPAPKVLLKQWFAVPYVYAAVLAVMAVVQLMGIGGFDFVGIKYETAGSPAMIAILAGLEIFALPFLLRLDLSPLARFFSALFAFVTPYFLVAHLAYLLSENVVSLDILSVMGVILLIPLAIASFIVLRGYRAVWLARR